MQNFLQYLVFTSRDVGEILDFYTKCILHMAYNMPGVNALKVDSHFYTKSANYALIIAACRRLLYPTPVQCPPYHQVQEVPSIRAKYEFYKKDKWEMKICGHFFFLRVVIFLNTQTKYGWRKKKVSIIHHQIHNHTRYPTKSECESNFNLKACLVKVG